MGIYCPKGVPQALLHWFIIVFLPIVFSLAIYHWLFHNSASISVSHTASITNHKWFTAIDFSTTSDYLRSLFETETSVAIKK